MSDDDPFFGGGDSDRTILRPRPGGRRPQAPPSPAATPPPQPAYGAPPPRAPQPGYVPPPAAPIGQLPGGLNPITGAATTLIALLPQLRESAHHPDPASLFKHIGNELKEFEATARAKGESPDNVLAARYVLCTAIDETVLNTPWGSQSVWATQTLLSKFHNETWGGEKFFHLLDRLIQEPARNLHLLELMYLCMALGFEGKYRVQERGRAEVERIQDNLYQAIRAQRGDFERSLAPNWRGLQDQRARLAQYVPLWVVAAIAGGVLIVVYIGFLLAANRAADPVLADIAAIGRDVPELGRDRAVLAAPRPSVDLRPFLQTEIADGRLGVSDVAHGQVVTMAGDGLFASGRAEVQAAQAPLLLAIGDALAQVPGQVVVTGHSDNVPMSAFGRYKSNWDLSEARANAVQQILSTRVGLDRLRAEGVADTRPIVPNDTPANRARNRRVEIMLLAQAGRQ